MASTKFFQIDDPMVGMITSNDLRGLILRTQIMVRVFGLGT